MQSSIETSLLKKVGNRLINIGLDLDGAKLLVGVSGGSDSVALAMILNQLKGPLGFDIHLAHLDHGLREDSPNDAKFVSSFSESLGVSCTIGKEDVASHRYTNRLSIEESARQLRYEFLVTVAKEIGASSVVVGHTSDDQIETLLMNIIRGGGINGLAGMADMRSSIYMGMQSDISIIRPLLGIRKADTLEYCRSSGTNYLEDPSNASLDHTRNRIRLELIPHLLQFNSKFGDNLLKLSDSARVDLDFISEEASRKYQSLLLDSEHGIRLDRDGFCNIHPSLQRHILRLMYANLIGSNLGLEYHHVQDMIKVSYRGTGLQIHLPHGLVFWTGYDYVGLTYRDSFTTHSMESLDECFLRIPGDIVLSIWHVNCAVVDSIDDSFSIDGYAGYFDRKLLGEKLMIRSRRPGDRFYPFGMKGSKSVDKYLSDAKVPLIYRDSVPVLVADDGIIWLVGHRTASWSAVSNDTKEIVQVRFTRRQSTSLEPS